MTWIAQTSALFSPASKSFNNTAATASGNQEENGIWALLIIANKTKKKVIQFYFHNLGYHYIKIHITAWLMKLSFITYEWLHFKLLLDSYRQDDLGFDSK